MLEDETDIRANLENWFILGTPYIVVKRAFKLEKVISSSYEEMHTVEVWVLTTQLDIGFKHNVKFKLKSANNFFAFIYSD